MALKSLSWNSVRKGTKLPEHTREITRTTIVSTALATRDFQTVHHDHEAAKKEGAKDIFLNIISTGGLIGEYMTKWSGPKGKLKKMSINLGATVFPGDALTTNGKVEKRYKEEGEHLVDVSFNLSVAIGPHAWGTVTMALPAKK